MWFERSQLWRSLQLLWHQRALWTLHTQNIFQLEYFQTVWCERVKTLPVRARGRFYTVLLCLPVKIKFKAADMRNKKFFFSGSLPNVLLRNEEPWRYVCRLVRFTLKNKKQSRWRALRGKHTRNHLCPPDVFTSSVCLSESRTGNIFLTVLAWERSRTFVSLQTSFKLRFTETGCVYRSTLKIH